jgi:ATP-dependent RNA helicase RhlE
MTTFSSLGVAPALLKALSDQQYEAPYPIQEAAIPAILTGRDVLGIARTGSGKTAGYALPILTQRINRPAPGNRQVKVLILVPTRELAGQVKDVFQAFSKNLPSVKTLAVFGGVSINPQMVAMSGVSILVATPGRLLELVENRAVQLSDIDTLVLDEADKMLNPGFEEEMDRILALLPLRRQNLLFSATLSPNLEHIRQILLRDPIVLQIEPEADHTDLIAQSAYLVTEDKKGPLLRYLLKTEEYPQVLVFTSSVFKADNVAEKLVKHGIDAMAIHSKKSQEARTDALTQFKAGRLRVLVATDLISRGIDIKYLPCVINYELPRSPKDYIHRIGRTGRAESPGVAISLITEDDLHHFKVIQKKMKKTVEVVDAGGMNLRVT